MTGYKQDPLRRGAEEERFDEAEQERLDMHEEYLRRVNASNLGTGISSPPARIGAISTPPSMPIFQGRPASFDPALGEFSKHWTSDIRVAQNFGPNIYTTNVSARAWEASQATTLQANPNIDPRNVAMGLERHLPLSYAKGAFPVSVATGVPAPSLTPQQMPAAIPPARIAGGPSFQDEMLADRLRGLTPAVPAPIGPTGYREGIARGMRNIQGLAGLPSADPMLGNLQVTGRSGGMVSARYESTTQPGVLNVPTGAISGIQERLTRSLGGAAQRFAGMDPTARAINIQKALYGEMSSMGREAETEARTLERGGRASTAQTVREASSQAQLIGKKLVMGVMNGISEGVDRGQVRDLAFNAARGNIETLAAMATGQGVTPQAAGQIGQQIAQMGGVGAVGVGGGTVTYATGGGAQAAYTVPPGGGRPPAGAGGGGGRQGMWEGNLGGLMYGAYIAKRFWSYTGAPAMRAMGEYAGVQAGLEPMMTGQIPQGGAGAYQAQQGIGQYMLGQGAYNIMGGAMSLSAQALQVPGIGTAAAGAGIFGGAALGARILGTTMGNLTGLAGRAGKFLGGAATPLALGGAAITTMQVGQNLYGGMTGRDVNTWGMIGAAGQTVSRVGAAAGGAVGLGISSLLGREDEFAQRYGQLMGGAYGDYLNRDWGVEQQGSGMASAQRIAEVAGQLNVAPADISTTLAGAIGMTGQQGLEGQNLGLVTTMNKLMQTRGISGSGAAALMGGYAETLGYLPGEQGFGQAANVFGGRSLEQQSQMMQAAQSRAGQAGQFRQVIGRGAIGDVPLRSMMGAFGTQQIGQVAFGGVSQLIAGGLGQQQAMNLGVWGGMAVTAGQMTQNQFQGGMGMAGMMQDYMGPSGGVARSTAIMQAYGGMSQTQMDLTGRIAGGDFGAMSFAANTGALPGFEGMAMQDMSGAPMYMSNLQQGMRNLNQVAGQMGMGPGGQYAGGPGMGNLSQFMQTLQGTGSMGQALGSIGVSDTMASFFEQNPEAGLTAYQREFSNQQFGRQMAGIGIGQQRIQMQRQFMYGGGDWRNPTEGSLWGIQDRMRSLQWQGQQAGAAFSLERMDVGNQFGMRQEDLSGRRMGMQQDYQRWGMGFQRAGMDMSRQFTMENRQYQDQLRGMQTSFTMEDFEENIRMSSGRQRRQLVTQRERFVSMTNVQDEQTERQREQQEELWAREDEQFEKKREYMEATMTLDEEQFNMNVERRETLFDMDRGDLERRIELAEQLHELQDEQMAKQREYAVAQMDLAEKALGIQAASAIAQKEYSDDMLALYEDTIKPVGDTVENIAQNDPVPMLKAVEDMAKAMNEMGVEEAKALQDLFKTVGGINPGGISALNRQLQILMATAGYSP